MTGSPMLRLYDGRPTTKNPSCCQIQCLLAVRGSLASPGRERGRPPFDAVYYPTRPGQLTGCGCQFFGFGFHHPRCDYALYDHLSGPKAGRRACCPRTESSTDVCLLHRYALSRDGGAWDWLKNNPPAGDDSRAKKS
jgi:hypothetical protein